MNNNNMCWTTNTIEDKAGHFVTLLWKTKNADRWTENNRNKIAG